MTYINPTQSWLPNQAQIMHDTPSGSRLRVGLSIVYNWRLIRKPALHRVEYLV